MSFPANPAVRGDFSDASARLRRVGAALRPFLLLILWTATVRLPFYGIANGDEFFFSVVAGEWLKGGLPYVDAFDIKPPGIFFIYAVVQAIFGASYATFKGMEIVAVAIGAWSLFIMLRPFGSGRLALWVAALFPVYTLAFDGAAAVNMLLQLPFVIAAFAGVVAATNDDARRPLAAAFLAGLAIGAAGMIKQTAVFEATAACGLLAVYAGAARPKALAVFAAGAAVPALAFAAYFFLHGHLGDMFNSVVVLALQRLDDNVINAYGPQNAFALTIPGAAINAVLRSLPVIFLWGGAVFALLRLETVKSFVPLRVMVVAGTWLGFAFADVVFGRVLCDYYLLAIVPPLLILAGAFFCFGLHVAPSHRQAAFWVSLVLGCVTLVYTEHSTLFGSDPLAVDSDLAARTADDLRALGLEPGQRLLVVNRGLELYTATGARPPTPYFHPTHLVSAFQTPSPDPLGAALDADPRFIVLADPAIRHITELPGRMARVEGYLAEHYRLAASEHGREDTYSIYAFVH